MDRRTILAIGLSFLVIFAYSALVKSKTPPPASESSQVVENKKDTSNQATINPSTPPATPNIATTISEETSVLENQDLKVTFSSRGGVIKDIVVKKFNHPLPVRNIGVMAGYENTNFKVTGQGDNWIQYSLVDNQRTMVRKYDLSNGHTVKLEVTTTDSPKESTEFDGLVLDMSNLDTSHLAREGSLFEYSVSADYAQIFRKGNATHFATKESKEQAGIVNWMGFRDHYFCVVVKPGFKTEGYKIDPVSNKTLAVKVSGNSTEEREGRHIYNFLIYAGPQEINVLKKADADFDSIVSYSGFGLFDLCAKGIYKLMTWTHRLVPSWGWCIILVSMLIYGVMYPLTAAGMSSMKRMQALQPEMARLREQYKNNPQKLNQEVMQLYKKNKVNPFGGCLPFLLQMPIFIGLYQVLWRSIFLKGADFLWIKDLSEPDRLFILPFNMPFLGNEFNLLPILMAIVMFFQQRLSTKNMVVVTPEQAMQQKLMGIFFPIFLGVLFYKFASGLALYFVVFYSLSTLAQWKMSKSTPAVIV